MHPHFHAGLDAPRDSQVLDAIAELLGVADVLQRDAGDALGVHALERKRRAERDGGEDRELVRGVDALDVERRVRLRVAETLRLAQDLLERGPAVAHLGQDEVARPVDDAREPLESGSPPALRAPP